MRKKPVGSSVAVTSRMDAPFNLRAATHLNTPRRLRSISLAARYLGLLPPARGFMWQKLAAHVSSAIITRGAAATSLRPRTEVNQTLRSPDEHVQEV